MNAHARRQQPASLVQPFMEDLVARSGIAPGMRALVLGAGRGDLAFLVAERVGPGGVVVGVDRDLDALARARTLAREQYFPQVSFELPETTPELFDAVVARFHLMRCADPIQAIRDAAVRVRPGGRIVFAEWHLESMLWEHTSNWPVTPQYRRYATVVLRALKREGIHVDMGLRLVNAFSSAGLPMPAIRTDLRTFSASAANMCDPFVDALPELLAPERHRLAKRVFSAEGYVFAPLLVGAWTCKPAN